jgi:glycosyltransferase involved in cell wall biosynthesis
MFSGPPHGTAAYVPADLLRPAGDLVVVYRDQETICGLSKAGLQTATALRAAGFAVVDFDYSLPRDRMEKEYRHNAAVFTNSRRKLHIVNLNPEYVPECLLLHRARIQPSDYIIGQFYWELSRISAVHQTAISLVDEIWVASSYLVDVFSQHTDKPVIKMGQAVTPQGSSSFTRRHFGLPEKDYLFLVTFDAGSSIERKNPLAAVCAFRRAFPKGVERVGLIVKTRNTANGVGQYDLPHWTEVLEETRADPRIRIVDKTFAADELAGLLDVCDCYVSLHRSEGFGYGVAEALLQAKPVITTAYSAVLDFCTDETSLLVPYELTAVKLGAYPYMDADQTYFWADPDIPTAASQMQRLAANPAEGRAIGERGRSRVQSEYSVQALGARYQNRLFELGFHPHSSELETVT